MASAADLLARTTGRPAPRLGLVAPLPPQVGGVASVAEWLLEHQRELEVRYETFDLERPQAGVGGRWSVAAALRQALLVARFTAWAARAPRVLHFCVSCTPTGLARDAALLGLARLAGRRAIAHIHGSDLEDAVRSPSRRRLLGVASALAEECIALSPSSAALLGTIGIRAGWIPNPVRLAPTREREQTEGGPLRLLLVGRYGERKGCFELVEALARVREGGVDATLELVGREEHPGEEELLRRRVRARALEDSVRFAGVRDRDELAARYFGADVLCLPSRREGLPMAVLEGMAFGLPVLATRVGGVADLVEDGRSGYLVDPEDVEGLATRIRDLADGELRLRMGRAAKTRVNEFAADESIVARWRDLYAVTRREEA
ncbi:MAG: glycosyltransferase family 4 protein [Gaiellales bacterium]